MNRTEYEKYASRINRVIDYIDANFAENFTLEELAQVADFSKYHFCRVFQSFTGEALFDFISRVRMERSAEKLVRDMKIPITRVALDCGYSSSAVFAKAFREKFKMTPSQWRLRCKDCIHDDSNTGKMTSNQSKEFDIEITYIGFGEKANTWRFKMNEKETQVKIVDWPETTVAYVRYVGPYAGDEELFKGLWNKLCGWAGPRGLLVGDTKYLIIYHDSPEITSQDKLRTSVCVSIPPNTEVSGEVGKLIIQPGKYAIGRFHLGGKEYGEAWNVMSGKWLPQSGYQFDDRPCFEFYPQAEPDENGKMVVDICIPVKPL